MLTKYFTCVGSLLDNIYLIIKETRFLHFNNLRHIDFNTKNTIHILGNGKSLIDNSGFNDDVDYVVVNRHVLSEDFETRKPKFYVLADPHFFLHPEGISVLQEIKRKTEWDMYLFVPYDKSIIKTIKNIVKDNKFIHLICFYGTVATTKIDIIDYFLYKHNLGTPRLQNVLVAALYISIFSGAKTIKLYGVEHSWTKGLFVNDANEVCLYNPHFYDKGTVESKKVNDIQHSKDFWGQGNLTIGYILHAYANMFDAYHVIKRIADKEGVSIFNMTKESFIDAFVRN